MENDRIILLVDMNSFFASIEQQCNPELRGKPVLVGGSPSKRSVVAAASYEARPYGVRSGMPLMEALQRCPDAILIEGNLAKYEDSARRVFRICMDYTDMMEIYSIDECFMDITATHMHFGGPWEIARAIKRRIRSDLGITCSVGIAPNKMFAKLASGMQKPDGLTEIKKEDVRALLENMPVDKLHGIGDKLKIHLTRMGISTAGVLGRTPVNRLKKEFGILGEILHGMGNGIDNTPVIPYHNQPDIKSVGHSYTLSKNTRDPLVISRQLLRLSEMVGWRLREQGYAGRTVSLVIRYSDMHTFSRQRSITEYLDDGYPIFTVALSILKQQQDNGKAIRLLGVSVSNLMKGMRQPDLFADHRWRNILTAMDNINNKYGEFTIKRASLVDLHASAKTHGFNKQPLNQVAASK